METTTSRIKRKPAGHGDGGGVWLGSRVHPGIHNILRGTLQAKLKIGAPNDVYEQEADRMAERVLRMPDPALAPAGAGDGARVQRMSLRVQRMCTECEDQQVMRAPDLQAQVEEDDDKALQAKHLDQASSATAAPAAAVDNPMRGGPGAPLADSVRRYFEPRMGASFAGVRVHHDAGGAAAASSLQARAFTVGRDITFNAGEYQPDQARGRRLLAHELTHVIQQGRARAR